MKIHKYNHYAQAYPARLREIASPPALLRVAGNHELLGDTSDRLWIAIVGTRKPSYYGAQMARQLAYDLAGAGCVIVSGLAYGIDSIAHQAAIDAGGLTVAVLAGGFPKAGFEKKSLHAQILVHKGAIVTEYDQDVPSYKQHFVARNRIVSGLSHGVLVVEAGQTSGTTHTAGFARDQNREVMAVPGNVTSALSAGTNNLLFGGAKLIRDSSDVFNHFNKQTKLFAKPIRADSPEEAVILELIKHGVTNSQQMIELSRMSPPEFANLMSLMEISGKIRNMGAGNWVSR